MKSRKIILPIMSAMALAVAVSANAEDIQFDGQPFIRPSLCTILLQSNKQDESIQKEYDMADENAWVEMFADWDFTHNVERRMAADSAAVALSKMPMMAFKSMPKPELFNDHGIGAYVIDYDQIEPLMEPEFIEGFRKGDPSDILNTINETFGLYNAAAELGQAVGLSFLKPKDPPAYLPKLTKFFEDRDPIYRGGAKAAAYLWVNSVKLPEDMMARWLNYDPESSPIWNDKLITERAYYSATYEEIQAAKAAGNDYTAILNRSFEAIDHTYVLIVNLRCRSFKAIQNEYELLTKDVMNSKIMDPLVDMLGGFTAFGSGDGFRVVADCQLYKLAWDAPTQNFAVRALYDDPENVTVQDLLDAKVCHLDYVGSTSTGCNVRQRKYSSKPLSDLMMRATVRTFDKAVAKLQEKHEDFRVTVPVSQTDPEGFIYAHIGLKEGVKAGDEYAILERVIDPVTGKTEYKKVGSAKAVKDAIWNNQFGAADEAAENLANPEAVDAEAEAGEDMAINLGATKFKVKKGKDFTGYYLKLQKKK